MRSMRCACDRSAMKTIFVSIYDGDTEKNILESKVLPTLVASGARIVVLARGGMGKKYERYASDQVIIVELPPAGCFSERLFYWLGWNAIPTHSIAMRRYETYLRNRKWSRLALGRAVGFFGHFRWFRNLLRFIYGAIPDDYAHNLFERYKPDILFAPNMFGYEDGRLLRAAKRLRVSTVTTSKSWDVLTNKAFTRVIADRILVQNASIRDAAIKHGEYKPSQVAVVGFVQFDYVADPSILMPRAEFFAQIGADPKKKLILYATSGDWKNPFDDEVVEGIHEALASGAIHEPAQILARFHPKYPSTIEKLDLPLLIKDRPGTVADAPVASLDGMTATVYDFSFTTKDVAHLANSIYHSDVTINTTSTMTLDAVAFDKPVVLICHDGKDRTLPYWKSMRRMFDEDHYQEIMRVACAKKTCTLNETIAAIDAYLTNPKEDAQGREELRRAFLGALDGRAGERMGLAVLELA
jgi:hypothetical protein